MARELVWLTENYPPQRGGMAQSCDRIIRNLRSRGEIIHIIHFSNRAKPFKTEKQLQGTYTAIPFEEDEAHILQRTWSFLKKFKTASHLICYGGYLSMMAAPVFTKWFDWTMIYMVRGNDFDASLFTSRKQKLLEDVTLAAEQVWTVSSEKAQRINKLFDTTKAVYTPNGIECDKWVATDSEKSKAEVLRKEWKLASTGKKCIGLVGQLKAKKGASFFIESFVDFPVKDKIHLVFIGDIDENLLHYLNEQQFAYSHYPFLDRYELIPFYLAVDAIAIPSFYDGMPNVLLEAASLGTPILASAVDGMYDVLNPLETNLLFEVGNSDDCRKAIYQWLELDEDQIKNYKEKLQKHIYENYSAKNEVENLLDLLNSTHSSLRTDSMRFSKTGRR